MELLRSYCGPRPLTLALYLEMQRALMARFVARGGTAEDFCARIAPVFRRKYGPLLEQSVWLRRAA
jgi:hypothetical protein